MLTPAGPEKKRSWVVSIRFGEFRKRIGLGEMGQDFHALRYTFTEKELRKSIRCATRPGL